jgi:hypothetical protein
MFDRAMTTNRLVRVRFVRGCLSGGRAYAEDTEASINVLEAGLLLGQNAVELKDPADQQLLHDAARDEFRDTELRLKRLDRSRP